MKQVKVIDAVCSSGKTTSIINYINSSCNEEKFIYITPFLTEVQRIKECCKDKNFFEPKKMGTKLEGIKQLIKRGNNIVSTHALFNQFDQETIEIAYLNNYTLILDEVANVVEPLNISKSDFELILNNCAEIQEDGRLVWYATDYKGEFEKYKRLCDLDCLMVCNNTIFLWMFPVSVFKAFKEVYILTYLFDAQIQSYYYKYFNVEWENLYVKDFHITTEPQDYNIEKYKEHIHIYNNQKANSIGDFNYTLSSSWYKRNAEDKDNFLFQELKKKCMTFYRYMDSPSDKNMWTCYKDYKNLVGGNGYKKGFVSLGARATNMYIDKDCLAYLANIYLNPYISQFFKQKGIQINEDKFALSEMLQWIFRSALREQKDINIYIPSKRMRTLLEEWN